MRSIRNDNRGETNCVALMILLVIVIVMVILFRPYFIQLAHWFVSLFQ